MIALSVTVVTLLALVAVLMLATRGHGETISSVEQLSAVSLPVDLDAFRNLTSISDEEYLRRSLSPRAFRKVQRAREIAAFDYVRRVAHNSAILMRLGEGAQTSSNADLVAAGAQLANDAFHTRVLALSAMAVIVIRIVLPQLRISSAGIGDRYAATRTRVVAFGRIEQPTLASRIEASL
jgi:hypothetical protein